MKFKLITAVIAALAIVSCNSNKGETKVEEATPSTVSASLAPVAQIFDGEKYVSTQLAHHNDYFIVYFTASW